MVAMALLVNPSTFSWFNARADSGLSVRADTTEDIISNFEVDRRNPENIVVQRADGLDYDPVVYFSVTGDAADYILHINPCKLEDNNRHSIKIRTDVNLAQLTDLLLHGPQVIKGTITLKHMNEYIIESREIEFTRDYLMNRYWAEMDGIASGEGKIASGDKEGGRISDLIVKLAGLIDWDGVSENYVKVANGPAVSNASVGAEPYAGTDMVVNQMPELSISDGQTRIVDTVVPGLMDYIGRLYRYAEDLIRQLNEKIEAIIQLNADIEKLNGEKTLLEQEKQSLTEDNDKLKEDAAQLEDKNKQLNDEIGSLKDEISGLRSRNSSLENQNDGLRGKIDELLKAPQNGNGSAENTPADNTPAPQPPVVENPVNNEPPAPQPPVIRDPTDNEPPAENDPEPETPAEEEPTKPGSEDGTNTETPPSQIGEGDIVTTGQSSQPETPAVQLP